MSSGRIILARHCEATGGPAGFLSLVGFYQWEAEESARALAPRGRLRAEDLAEQLAALRPDTIIVSPIKRAMETAAPLLSRAGKEPLIWPELAEIRFGRLPGAPGLASRIPAPSGLLSAGLRVLWAAGRAEGIDPPAAAAERAALLAERLSAMAEEQTVVVVSHGITSGFLRAALVGARSAPLAWARDPFRTGEYRIYGALDRAGQTGPSLYREVGRGRGRAIDDKNER